MGVQVLSYNYLQSVSSSQKVHRILEIVKKGDVVLIEGKLTAEEEMTLTSKTMENVSKDFSGIEIAYLGTPEPSSTLEKIRDKIVSLLAKDRMGITAIGPSKIIKEIKSNPSKLEILFK